MYAGRFIVPPIVYPTKLDELIWLTIGSSSPFGGGDEKGYVAADAGPHHFPVKFNFFNPASGPNTCGVEPPHVGRCAISQGVHAGAQFFLDSLSPTLSDSNDGDKEGDNSGDTP